MSVDQIAELKETFALFDKDGDGAITIPELADVLRDIGQVLRPEDVQKMIQEADLDANGVVDFPEFLAIVANRMLNEEENEQDLWSTFRYYDLNRTGLITASNLKFAMGRMGCRMTPEEADEMIREADLDGDGRLNYREFRRLMMSQVGQ